ncbi:unnamed protein product [Ranitomeya imitator]|uniref:Helix-turn-helix domain-containing protein n=1 Tax=Ranitomeya imitator TaxID=111125 RepID=A0ABN9KVX4_9NEOB|nr:unnamed protein product [Ranitomeya imitator]
MKIEAQLCPVEEKSKERQTPLVDPNKQVGQMQFNIRNRMKIEAQLCTVEENNKQRQTPYIDDVFVIWTGTVEQFDTFIMELNINDMGLRFTSEVQNEELAFLDVMIRRTPNGGLTTSIYRKPTSTNSLLNWHSHHPIPLKKGIPKGQFLRLRRNCSNIKMFHSQAGDMFTRFREKNYPPHILTAAYNVAANADRQQLLQKNEQKLEDEKIRIIGTFDSQHQKVRGILNKHWDILRMDPDLRDLLGARPDITFRKGRSLKDSLVHSHYLKPTGGDTWLGRKPCGFLRCGGCQFCRWMKPNKSFTSSSTGKVFFQRDFSNCKSTGVVYMASCPCPKDYIGKTIREFRRRVGEHLGDIRHNRDTALARHMRSQHPDKPTDVTFTVIEVHRDPLQK